MLLDIEHTGSTFAARERASVNRSVSNEGLTSANDQVEQVTLSEKHLKRERERER